MEELAWGREQGGPEVFPLHIHRVSNLLAGPVILLILLPWEWVLPLTADKSLPMPELASARAAVRRNWAGIQTGTLHHTVGRFTPSSATFTTS